MGGEICLFDLDSFVVVKTLQAKNQHMTNIRISSDYVVASSYSGIVVFIKISDFSIDHIYEHSNSVSALCTVGDGVVYALQNDNVFHFRPSKDHSQVQYFLMNPNELDVHGFGIRDMHESSSDPNAFVALTDQNRAIIYRYVNGAKDLEVLTFVTHIQSDGLTQPQILWPTGPIVISTTDDLKIVAIDLSSNSVVFEIGGYSKAVRCITFHNGKLIAGAFDKSIASYEIIVK